MNAIKKLAFTSVALATSAQFAFADNGGINFGEGNVQQGLKGTNNTLPDQIQYIITFITRFLYLIAVCYALYGGFLILTSGGNEENVKKGKTILMHGALGLLVIFLASTIISFVLDAIAGGTTGN